jgi:competence protein ComEC
LVQVSDNFLHFQYISLKNIVFYRNLWYYVLENQPGGSGMPRKRGRFARKVRCLLLPALVLVILLVTAYLAFPHILQKDTAPASIASGSIEVHFINVGQGDSILIRTDSGNMLVDAGPGAAEESLSDYLERLGVTGFEYAVFTHPHEDHIGGADMILTDFTVSSVILPDCTYNSATYTRMTDAIDKSGAEVIVAQTGSEFTLGEMKATILAPNSQNYKNTNDYSIVLKIEFGQTSFLLTGDAETTSEAEMLITYGPDMLKCDLLKVGHHGSNTSTSPEFLAAVLPKYAVISCGRGNSYGHPHAVTLQKLMNAGVTVYRTDEPGGDGIVFVSDGVSLTPKSG